jgi:hypothetical protein
MLASTLQNTVLYKCCCFPQLAIVTAVFTEMKGKVHPVTGRESAEVE